MGCPFDPPERIECGREGIGRDECEAKPEGCCFEPTNNAIHCSLPFPSKFCSSLLILRYTYSFWRMLKSPGSLKCVKRGVFGRMGS